MSKSFPAHTWFVTGASGLVGSTIVEKLRENDLKVIALVRKNTPKKMLEFLENLGVKLVFGDILNITSYQDYLPVCDVLIHAAATVRNSDEETNWKVNHQGTETICQAMRNTGLNRLIHISTAGVYGKTYRREVTEEELPKPFGHYRISKYTAEKVINEDFPDISATIIRPAFVFGAVERERHLYTTLIDQLPTKLLPRIWRKDPKFGFVHADDIARFVLLVGTKSKTPSVTYNIQSFSLKLSQIYEMVNAARGTKSRTIPLPFSLVYLGALVGELFGKIQGKKIPLRKRLAMANKNWIFSITRAQEELGFEPIHKDIYELERLMTEYYRLRNRDEGSKLVNMQDYLIE